MLPTPATRITTSRLIAIVRSATAVDLPAVAEALLAGGVTCLEITANTPDWERQLTHAAASHPAALLGVGTVTTAETARRAAGAGARFLVTPVVSEAVLRVAREAGIPTVMGALSPTEIHHAHRLGAEFIKLFPAAQVGPDYLRAVRSTLGEARFVPTGGVGEDNAAAWFAAGATALGVGSSLLSQKILDMKDYPELTRRAQTMTAVCTT